MSHQLPSNKRKGSEDLDKDIPNKRFKSVEPLATFDISDPLFSLPLTHVAEMLCPFDCFLLSLTCKTLRSISAPIIKRAISKDCSRSTMHLKPMTDNKVKDAEDERLTLTSCVWEGKRMNVYHVTSKLGVWTFCIWEFQNALTGMSWLTH